ncbi:UNVERIFIED_CONTAM: hypothetical protein HDU68_006836 [Siphonaria sp. JEL0065]|nr:hypothetical protein HDU68_006836 [Siphonaria sp. JEL0065]
MPGQSPHFRSSQQLIPIQSDIKATIFNQEQKNLWPTEGLLENVLSQLRRRFTESLEFLFKRDPALCCDMEDAIIQVVESIRPSRSNRSNNSGFLWCTAPHSKDQQVSTAIERHRIGRFLQQ